MERRRRALAALSLGLLMAGIALIGALSKLDLLLMDLRFAVEEYPVSDSLVVVEIDPYSLQHDAAWPWPRDRYAALVTNLKQAGANIIAFDIDFSTLGSAKGDAIFAEVLSKHPGEVVLPVFSQLKVNGGHGNEVVVTKPSQLFLSGSVMASVNIMPEANGILRRGGYGEASSTGYRAALATVLAGAPGMPEGEYYYDFSIDPQKIQRLSFYDVVQGNFDPKIVRGKNIIVGATALELGDEFVAPRYGVLPGVLFHAIGYETLVADRAIKRSHPFLPAMIAIGLIFVLIAASRVFSQSTIFVVNAALAFVIFMATCLLQSVYGLSIDIAAVFVAQIGAQLLIAGERFRVYATTQIAQRKTIAYLQALTSLAVSETSDGILVADQHNDVKLCNPQAKTMLDRFGDIAPGASMSLLPPSFPRHRHEVGSAPATLGGQVVAPQELAREFVIDADGDLIVEVTSKMVALEGEVASEGEQCLIIYTLHDISSRKKIERDEAAAKEAAIAASKMKSHMIANMSHELRTPLNGVIGFSEILKTEAFGPLGADEYKEFSDNIFTSGHRLLALVNDMLTISSLDALSTELDANKERISDILSDVTDAMGPKFEEQGKTLHTHIQEDLPQFMLDYNVIKQIIGRLLDNCLTFTDEGGRAEVAVRQRKNVLAIDIADNGCGVPAQELEKLTDAFYQANTDLSRAHEGAGLGLHLVEKYVQLHGGTLELSSKEGDGFLAKVRIPDVAVEPLKKSA